MTDMGQKLRGIIPPLITPLSNQDTLDVEGLERLIEHVVSGGVHGLFILGTTGEGPHLSYALRRELIDRVVQQVCGRVSVLVGISDTSYVESVSLGRFAADHAADAVVVSVPYYLQASQQELFCYVEQLSQDVPLPLLLYNFPQMTKVGFDVETVRRAFELPNVIGLKDSSHNLNYFHSLLQLVERRPDKSLFMGSEDLLAAALRAGADGGVPGGANLFPKLFVELFEAYERKDDAVVDSLHAEVIELNRLLYSVGDAETAPLKSIKYALHSLGICQEHLALPLQPYSDEARQTVHRRLQRVGARGGAAVVSRTDTSLAPSNGATHHPHSATFIARGSQHDESSSHVTTNE